MIVFDEEEFDRLLKESENDPHLKINLGDSGLELTGRIPTAKEKKVCLNSTNVIMRIKNTQQVRQCIKSLFGNIRVFCDKYELTCSNVYQSLDRDRDIVNYPFINVLIALKIPMELEFFRKKAKGQERERII